MIEKTNMHVLFTSLFAVGSNISILRAPMAAAIYELTEPSQPMMNDDVSDEK